MLRSCIGSILLVVLTTGLAGAGPKYIPAHENPVKDQYIVVLEDAYLSSPGKPAVHQAARDLAFQYGGKVIHVYEYALKGFSIKMTEARARNLSNDSRVKYVEQDAVVQATATQTGATWGLDRIDQRDLPLNTTYVYNSTGAGVHAYIIDTGIRTTHNEFGSRATGVFESIGDGNGTNDCNGHGTHVAGTVGGSTWGVAKSVNLYAVRVLSCGGSGTWEGVIAGVDWVTAHHNSPAVANMSLGGGFNSAMNTAIQNSVAAGVTYAIAAGNSNADACSFSPASAPDAITVGATQNNDARASFSNFGSCLDIFGPGVNITSSWIGSDTATNTISGTSMATPHVAGVVALYLEGNPSASPATVRQALVSNATPNKVGSPGTGSPNLLLYSLIGGGGSCSAPSSISNNTAIDVNSCADSGVSVSWSNPGNWGDGGTGTRSYEVLRNGVSIQTLSFGTTTWTDTSGTNGVSYSYSVRYRNGCGSTATTAGASAADNIASTTQTANLSSAITAKNNIKSAALIPAFTTAAGQATDADITWSLSGSTDLLACTQVVLRGPNGATKTLKAFNAANTGSATVLDLYSSSGAGTYTLELQEKSSGCGGKNQNARISAASMTVEKASSCN